MLRFGKCIINGWNAISNRHSIKIEGVPISNELEKINVFSICYSKHWLDQALTLSKLTAT